MSSEARKMLRSRMAERGLTQTRLAALLERKPSTVSRWLNEERPNTPDAVAMVALERAFGIPMHLWLSPGQLGGIEDLAPIAKAS